MAEAETKEPLEAAQPPFDIVMSPVTPHIFCDGLAQLQMGYPITALYMHDVVMPPKPGGREQRRISLVLQMPTISLLEICKIVMDGVKDVGGQLTDLSSDQQKKLLEMMTEIQARSSKA